MLADPRVLGLGGGIVLLLAVFTVVGQVLAGRAGSEAKWATIDNLNARIRSWWVMVAVFAAAILLGDVVTLVLFALLSFMALREFLTLTPTKPGDHRAMFACFFVFLPAQYLLIGWYWYGLFAVLIPVYAFLLLPAVAAVAGDTEDYLARCAKVQWGLMLTVYAISHAPALLMLEIQGYALPSALLLLWLSIVVQLSDVFQYVFGKLFGRTKIAPRVSPSKTVEGLLGGGATAILIGTALCFVTPFSPLAALGMSTAVVVMGFLGGFALSAIKRDLGAKDWGRSIEGHGGVLDRLDLVAFAAPIFFHLTRYWYT